MKFVKLENKNILRRLKIHKQPNRGRLLQDLIDEERKIATGLIEEKYFYKEHKILIHKPSLIVLEEDLKIQSKKVSKLLKNAFKVYLVVATIGKKLEERMDLLINEKEITRAHILDAIGSVAIEELIEGVNEQIRNIEGTLQNTLTRRYSPGYGDWSLKAQEKLLKILETRRMGISMTPGNIMYPQKSITTLIGVIRGKET